MSSFSFFYCSSLVIFSGVLELQKCKLGLRFEEFWLLSSGRLSYLPTATVSHPMEFCLELGDNKVE
jgi:hypothetical protein